MRFIDKADLTHKNSGRQQIDRYITDAWNSDEARYVGIVYANGNVSQCIKPALIAEQKHYCCYCMRKIDVNNSTIEHVIPRNCKADECKVYQDAFNCLDSSNVIYINQEPNSIITTPPYPHQIAYENMVASCVGYINNNKCCNSKRGKDMIVPLFFIPNVSEIIKYSKSGYVYDLPNKLELQNTIKILNLNDKTLVEIRLLWKVIARKFNNTELAIVNIANAVKYIATNISTETSSLYEKYTQPEYFRIFISYSWFKEYYLQNK